MSSDDDNYKIINDIYFDEAGYGSIKNTYSDARIKDSKITLKYVETWFSKNVGNNKQPGGNNSYIAPHPHYEYQVDLCFFNDNDLPNQKFKEACVCIDVFSKYAAVVPIVDRKAGPVAAGILECFKLMGKKPETLYTDDEASLSAFSMIEYYKENKSNII